ncbi:MAG: hypothetical protein ACI8UO_004280 [Verrucomicrobiales bacterium]|jgi:hypothetical protein
MKTLFIFLLVASATFAAEPTNDFTVPAGMVRREFPLGQADLNAVEEFLGDTLSDGGKFHIFKTTRKLLVIDKPEQLEAVRQLLPHVAKPPPNVKIEFISRSVTSDPFKQTQVRGNVRGGNGNVFGEGQVRGTPGVFERNVGGGDRGDIRRPVQPGGARIFDSGGGGAIEVDILNQKRGGGNLNASFVVVRGGNEGTIEVVREVPMVNEFTRFIVDGSFGAVLGNVPRVAGNNQLFALAGGSFEVPEVRYENAGTRLLVRPIIEGNLIHLEIMPQISSVVIVDPDALRRRELNTWLTGREQYVTFTKLKTTVTVANGAEVVIGGFVDAPAEFNRYIWGAGRSGGTTAESMTVRATIQ